MITKLTTSRPHCALVLYAAIKSAISDSCKSFLGTLNSYSLEPTRRNANNALNKTNNAFQRRAISEKAIAGMCAYKRAAQLKAIVKIQDHVNWKQDSMTHQRMQRQHGRQPEQSFSKFLQPGVYLLLSFPHTRRRMSCHELQSASVREISWPTAVEPFFTASWAYSTWNKCPSGENTVIARSYFVVI